MPSGTRLPRGVRASLSGLAWRRPSRVTPGVYDAFEVAPADDGHGGVYVRSSLGRATLLSGDAFADFVDAARSGEYDQMLPDGRRPVTATPASNAGRLSNPVANALIQGFTDACDMEANGFEIAAAIGCALEDAGYMVVPIPRPAAG